MAIGPLLFPTTVTTSDIRPAGIAAAVAVAVVTITIMRIRRHDWRTGCLFIGLYGGFFLFLL